MICISADKCGFINTKGETVIEAKYQALSRFHNGVAAVMLNNKWGFINKKGKVIIPFEYDWTGLVY